jgi:serine protease
MSGNSSARAIVEQATVKARPNAAEDARLCLFDSQPDALADALRADLKGLKFSIEIRSPEELMLTVHGRRFKGEAEAFAAAEAFAQAYQLDAAEPEIFFTAMPVDQADPDNLEGMEQFPFCWADPEPALGKLWALEAMRVPQAWAFAEARGRLSRGAGIVVAQPDTGITKHAELRGVTLVSPRNLLSGKPNDPTDPLPKTGNPGHGTSTASVLLSPRTLDIAGSAPEAKHMPIRAVESVALLSQIKVAQAIDHAVNNGAHVITMSLGGVASLSLWLALSRAVDSGVIVLAAAGNCVGLVVWPARYDKCIAVAGTNSKDGRWTGTCKGPEIDFSAPAQNVWRATAPDKGVEAGQGTSYAVALAAGVAACWLAFHGRANVVSAAKQRGETVQDMFRRMVQATARVPNGWDSFNMGAGIIDAEALLKADFDRGLGTESPTDPVLKETPANSVMSLALAKAGEKALKADIDWQRRSAEISLSLLRSGALPEPPKELPGLKPAVEAPRGAVFEAGGPPLESAGAAPPSPAIRRSRADMPAFRKLSRQKEIIARRAAVEAGGGLESGGAGADEPLSKDAASATLDRVTALAEKMPAREMGDKGTFAAALNMLTAHGGSALQKLVGDDVTAAVTPNDRVVLEAIIIADGSRPSFLIENDAPPLSHPFMGSWSDEIAKTAKALKPVCAAVGRIQPRFGHAGNFIGTGSLVDADKGIILTNYHVMDDARAKFGVLMEEKKSRVKIHGWLEIDFVGEASRFDVNRFRIVEARLPKNAGRGFGKIDAVTMVIEPVDGARMPKKALRFDAKPAAFTQAQSTTICTVGFPGPPRREQGPKGEIDWNFVIRTLFGDLFGVKRLAPGRLLETFGAVEFDPLGVVFGHEATTFGGASGSAMIGWENATMPSFGLHFSGLTGESNYAIAMAKVAKEMKAIGVPV